MTLLLDPNIAYVTLVVGLVLAVLAVIAPGTGLLEVGALVFIGMAVYSMINIPVNIWALVILFLGTVPLALAIKHPTQKRYMIITLAILVLSTYFTFKTPQGAPAVNILLAAITSIITVTLLWVVGRKSLETLRMQSNQEKRNPVGKIGDSKTDVFKDGTVYVEGEDWSARSQEKIAAGKKVKVIRQEGLILEVKEIKPGSK
jgi:membrane-bound ClpP family serine protease